MTHLTTHTIEQEIRPLFSRVLKAHEGTHYLANHSLGRPLDSTFDNIARGAALWAEKLDEAWSDDYWMGEAARFRSLIAQLLDLDDPKAVVPKTSAGQGLRAVLNSFPAEKKLQIVTTMSEFDSIAFILKAYQQMGRANIRRVPPYTHEQMASIYRADDIVAAIDDDTDLVVVSAVFFGTGQILQDLDLIIEKAHRHGAHVLLDVYHALGVFPFSMSALDADFCIGGCYKYLRGGPGSCFLAIHARILAEGRRTLDTGWFAKKDTFQYKRPESADLWPGGDGWLESTPPVLTAYQATPGLEFTLSVGVEQIRTYMLQLLAELRETLRSKDLQVVEPTNPSHWGAFALVFDYDPNALCEKLKEQGIITDARGEFVRFGPDILTRIDEMSEAIRDPKVIP